MNNKRTFFQVNALCGSGKTYQAIRWAIQQAHYEDQKTVVVFKTKDLMREAYADAIGFRDGSNFVVPIKNLNRDTLSAKGETKSVRMVLQQHLEEAKPNSGEVLLISEATFLAITYWPKRHWWHCVLDEIPAAAPAHEFRVPDHHRMLTQHLQLEPGTATHSLVTVKPEGRAPLQRIADNAGQDQVSELFSAWARQLLSPNYRMYTSTQGFHRVATDDSQGGYFTLQMFALLQPTVFGAGTIREFADITGNPRTVKDEFASVTIMGAAFTDSLLNFIWHYEEVQFVPHKAITNGLRFTQHDCGNRLELMYLSERPWSKYLRDQPNKDDPTGRTSLDYLIEAVKQEFQGLPFVYMVNKDIQQQVNDQLGPLDGMQLPNVPYGFNCYQRFHRAVILSALNPTPAHSKFLFEMGIDGEAVREAQFHQSSYQAIMRTSLRNKDATERVKVIVTDLGLAESLERVFPGATVRQLVTEMSPAPTRPVGRPSKVEKRPAAVVQSEAKRNSRYLRKMIADLRSGKGIDETLYAEMLASCRSDNKDLVQLKYLKEGSISCTSADGYQLKVPLFRSIHESRPAAEAPFDIRDYEKFIRQLKRASRVALASKKANLLMCTTEFRADLSTDTNRGIANITRIWGIWLDIDGGEMPRHHVPRLFPDLRMAVFNSWTPRNYRIFIPTQRITSVGEHAKVLRLILREIEGSALDSEITDAHRQRRAPRCLVSHRKAKLQVSLGREPNPVHGIDPSKFTANSLFYMPAQSASGIAGSFFDDHKGGSRLPLNVDLWLQRTVADEDELPEEDDLIKVEPISVLAKLRHALARSGSSANNGTQHDQVEVDAAITWYKEIPDGQGRHDGFFNAVLRIHVRGNVPLADLRPYMVLCDYDGHQKSQYASILRYLGSGKFASNKTSKLAA
jgi:hypothetical protein